MVNYLRKFVPHFSTIANPLYKLLRTDTPFNWTNECENAFIKLKTILYETTTLAHPDYNKEFILFSDASNIGLGGCLAQADENGTLKPLSYFSKTLSKTQQRYSTTKREGLALVSCLKHFQFILLGYPTIVCTDHRPLISLFSKKLPTDSALARWCISIQSFQLTLKYFPGKFNCVADYMSRIDSPPNMENINVCENIAYAEGNELIDDDDIESPEECVTLLSNEKPLFKYIPTLDEVSWSQDELIEAQRCDDFCVNISEQFHGKNLNSEQRPSGIVGLNNYLYLGGVLYKRRKIDRNQLVVLNIVIPTVLMEKAINSVHYVMHGDSQHTLFKFRFRYFHQYENRYMKNFVDTCDVCKILKGKMPRPISLKQAPVPNRPFENVSMDILGPLPLTDNGNKYILCVIDMFSRFCIIKALPTKETDGIINCLNEIFNYWGFPSVLLSDNALEFTSEALMQFSTIYSIKKTQVLPYSPYSNGIVERNNSKILKLLKLYVHSVEHGEWDSYILTVANCLNNCLNITLEDTPSFVCLNYDTSPNVSREDLKDIYNYDSAESLVTLREKRASGIRDHVRNVIMSNQTKQHSIANKKRKDRNIDVGSRVLFKRHNKTNKLDLNYLGPAVVTHVLDNYKLTVKMQNKVYDRININHCILLKNRCTRVF